MKKFLQTTVLVTLVFLSLNANAKSKLSIGTSMPTAMKVIIDGRKFYSQDNILNINNLQPGNHNITVYYIKNGKDFNSFYSNGNNSYWKKAVSRQVVVRNNYQYDITINRFGKAFFDQDYYSVGYYRGDGNEDENDDDDNYNSNYDFEDNNSYSEEYNDIDYFRNKAGSNQNTTPIRNGNYNSNNNSYNVISNQMFNQIKQTIQQQNFENSKLDFAKQSIDKSLITTNQIKEILNLFSMEMTKLEFAKYAYDKVIDKENYFTVTNAFSMQTNRDDLLKYIRNRK